MRWDLTHIRRLCLLEGDCWIYPVVNPWGFPKICKISGRRYVWELCHGEIPPRHVISTSCGCRSCVNPKHLVMRYRGDVSREVAARPTVRRRKSISGARGMGFRAKLTLELAQYVRNSDKSQTELARELGVSQQLLSRVRRGAAWVDHSTPFAGMSL